MSFKTKPPRFLESALALTLLWLKWPSLLFFLFQREGHTSQVVLYNCINPRFANLIKSISLIKVNLGGKLTQQQNFIWLSLLIMIIRTKDVFRNVCSWNKNQEMITLLVYTVEVQLVKILGIKWSCQVLDFLFFPLEAVGHTTSSSLLYVDSCTVISKSFLSGVMSCCSGRGLPSKS